MAEREILHDILLALGSRKDCRVWRNSVGMARDPISGRVVRFGVPGSADVFGIMDGGRFLSLEVKRPGQRPSDKQRLWREMVSSLGGLAAVVTSAEEAVRLVDISSLKR